MTDTRSEKHKKIAAEHIKNGNLRLAAAHLIMAKTGKSAFEIDKSEIDKLEDTLKSK